MRRVDRPVRALGVGPVLIALSVPVFGVGSVLGIVALVLAGVLLVTAAVGFCPGHAPSGISTSAASPPTAMPAFAADSGRGARPASRARDVPRSREVNERCDG
jgi:hypothetical protein